MSNAKLHVIAFSIASALLILVVTILPVRFELSDDALIMNLASGYYTDGAPSEYLVFVNILVGYVLQFLYRLIPEISWYGCALVFVHGLAMHVNLRLLVGGWTKADLCWKASFVLFVVLFHGYLLLRLQFTTTASIAAISGIAATYHYFFGQGSRDKLLLFLGVSLLIIGGLLRKNAFLLVLLMSVPILVQVYDRKSLWKAIGMVAVVVACVILAWTYNHKVYSTTAGYANYYDESGVRARLADHKFLDRDFREIETDLLDHGWEEPAFALFGLHFFDPRAEFQSEEVQRGIDEAVSRWKHASLATVLARTASLFTSLHILVGSLAFVVLLVGRVAAGDRRTTVYLLGSAITGLATIVGLAIYFKFPPTRVYNSVFAAIFLLGLVVVLSGDGPKSAKTPPGRWFGILALAVVTLVPIAIYNCIRIAEKNAVDLEESHQALNVAAGIESDCLFYYGATILLNHDPFRLDSGARVKVLGGAWIINTNENRTEMDECVDTNLYLDAVQEGSDIRLLVSRANFEFRMATLAAVYENQFGIAMAYEVETKFDGERRGFRSVKLLQADTS